MVRVFDVLALLQKGYESVGHPNAYPLEQRPEIMAKALQRWLKGNGIKNSLDRPRMPKA